MSIAVRTRAEPSRAPEPTGPGARGARRGRVLVPLAVVALAAVLRLWNLPFPGMTIADEAYYATDAANYLGGGVTYVPAPFETIPEEGTWMHPPLGKELIALGVGPLGTRSLGWRLPSAFAGIATVLLVYLLGLRLWRSVAWAGLASLLVAVDGLHVVLSRLAMLDVFLGAFVTAGFLFVVRELSPGRREGPPGTARFGGRELLLAGIMFGCAIATKWSGLFPLVVAVAILFRARRSPRALALSLVAVPVAVYVLAYLPFWMAHGPDVVAFVQLQAHMLARQLGTTSPNPLASSPMSWPVMLEPLVAYPASRGPIAPGAVRCEAIGNPVLWWGLLAVTPLLLWSALRRRDPAARLAVAGYMSLWTPWLLFGRTEYVYYMTPVVPFMAIGLVSAVRALPARARRPVAIAAGGLAVLAGAAFLPVWLGLPVSPAWYESLRWLPGWP